MLKRYIIALVFLLSAFLSGCVSKLNKENYKNNFQRTSITENNRDEKDTIDVDSIVSKYGLLTKQDDYLLGYVEAMQLVDELVNSGYTVESNETKLLLPEEFTSLYPGISVEDHINEYSLESIILRPYGMPLIWSYHKKGEEKYSLFHGTITSQLDKSLSGANLLYKNSLGDILEIESSALSRQQLVDLGYALYPELDNYYTKTDTANITEGLYSGNDITVNFKFYNEDNASDIKPMTDDEFRQTVQLLNLHEKEEYYNQFFIDWFSELNTDMEG